MTFTFPSVAATGPLAAALLALLLHAPAARPAGAQCAPEGQVECLCGEVLATCATGSPSNVLTGGQVFKKWTCDGPACDSKDCTWWNPDERVLGPCAYDYSPRAEDVCSGEAFAQWKRRKDDYCEGRQNHYVCEVGTKTTGECAGPCQYGPWTPDPSGTCHGDAFKQKRDRIGSANCQGDAQEERDAVGTNVTGACAPCEYDEGSATPPRDSVCRWESLVQTLQRVGDGSGCNGGATRTRTVRGTKADGACTEASRGQSCWDGLSDDAVCKDDPRITFLTKGASVDLKPSSLPPGWTMPAAESVRVTNEKLYNVRFFLGGGASGVEDRHSTWTNIAAWAEAASQKVTMCSPSGASFAIQGTWENGTPRTIPVPGCGGGPCTGWSGCGAGAVETPAGCSGWNATPVPRPACGGGPCTGWSGCGSTARQTPANCAGGHPGPRPDCCTGWKGCGAAAVADPPGCSGGALPPQPQCCTRWAGCGQTSAQLPYGCQWSDPDTDPNASPPPDRPNCCNAWAGCGDAVLAATVNFPFWSEPLNLDTLSSGF